MTSTTDQSLEALFEHYRRTGDADMFQAIYARVGPKLLRLACRYARSRSDAEDLLQSTFLRAIEARERWDASRALMPWLCGILVHSARKRRPRSSRPADTDGEAVPDQVVAFAAMAEFEDHLERAIGELSAPLRSVLELHVHEHLAPGEIALRLQRNQSTVRTQLARAIEQVRRALPQSLAPALVLSLSVTARGALLRGAVLAQAASRSPAAAAAAATTTGLARRQPRGARLALAAAVLLLVAGLVPWLASQRAGVERSPAGAPSAQLPRVAEGESSSARQRTPSAPDPASPRDTAIAAPAAATGELLVRVVEAASARPLARVLVVLGLDHRLGWPVLEQYDRGAVHAGTTDELGLARFTGLRPTDEAVVWLDNGMTKAAVVRMPTSEEVRVTAQQTLLLRGKVTDADGRPARARVLITSEPHALPGVVAAESDEHGDYAVRLAAGRRFWAWAEADGQAPSKVLNSFLVSGAGRLTFRLGPASPCLRGRVVDGSGEGIAEARLQFFPLERAASDEATPSTISARDGWFDLRSPPDGPLLAVARAAGRAPALAEIVDRDPPPSLCLGGDCALLGTVVDRLDPLGRLRVMVVPALRGERRRLMGALALQVPVAADGKFRVDGLPAGEVYVSVQDPRGSLLSGQTLRLASGSRVVHNVILDSSSAISGQLVDGEGRPLAAHEVFAEGEVGAIARCRSEADGGFRLRGLRSGSHLLRVERPGAGQRAPALSVLHAYPGTQDLRWVVEPARAGLRARVLLAEGAPAESASVVLRGLTQGDRVQYGVDGRGQVEIERLPARALTVGLYRRDLGTYWLGTKQLRGGEVTDLGDVQVPAPGTLDVEIEGTSADELARCDVTCTDALGEPQALSRPGGTRLRSEWALAPGRYLLQIHGRGLALVHTLEIASGPSAPVALRLVRRIPVDLRLHFDHATNAQVYGLVRIMLDDSAGHRALDLQPACHTDPLVVQLGLRPDRYRLRVATSWGLAHEADLNVPADTPGVVTELHVR
jgi:RNA polymerase sigma-70 factor (ECF subfamily)